MSDLENNDFLKVNLVRASGAKIELKLRKFPEYLMGITKFEVKQIEEELISALEYALYDVKIQGKNEINITFKV